MSKANRVGLTHPFDLATDIHPLRPSRLPFRAAAAGAKGYVTELDGSWWHEGQANAGYLAALLLRGMSTSSTEARRRHDR